MNTLIWVDTYSGTYGDLDGLAVVLVDNAELEAMDNGQRHVPKCQQGSQAFCVF